MTPFAATWIAVLLLQAPAPPSQPDPLAPTRAAYAALKSYADAATMVSEFGAPGALGSEKNTVRTFYRAPRDFLIEWNRDPASPDRIVVWGDAVAFHAWWAQTGVQGDFPPGTGGMAFVTTAGQTSGMILQVASMIFPKAGLTGTVGAMTEAADAGGETIAGHPCRKLVGKAQDTYGTGYVTNVRRVTIWIDAQTLLIRKMVEDASDGGMVARVTITFEPRANPTLEDAVFRFTPPK
jgi:outer membrane lipoprotein-sorting protein